MWQEGFLLGSSQFYEKRSPVFFVCFQSFCILSTHSRTSAEARECPENETQLRCFRLIGDFAKGPSKTESGFLRQSCCSEQDTQRTFKTSPGLDSAYCGNRPMSNQAASASCPPATHLLPSSLSPFLDLADSSSHQLCCVRLLVDRPPGPDMPSLGHRPCCFLSVSPASLR